VATLSRRRQSAADSDPSPPKLTVRVISRIDHASKTQIQPLLEGVENSRCDRLILAYSADGVDDELDVATTSFLETETTRTDGRLYVSRLLLYYRGDFGGRAGIYAFLERHGVIDADERPPIRYKPYDWRLQRGQYADGLGPE
jgi:hypothetical protein